MTEVTLGLQDLPSLLNMSFIFYILIPRALWALEGIPLSELANS